MAKNLYRENPSLYDLFVTGTAILAKRQQFFLNEARNAKKVIEIGAGTGNLSLALADHGMDVTCVEPSPTVLINLSAKVFCSAKYRERITLIPRRLEEAAFGRKKFDCVIISNVMPYIHNDRERIDMLKMTKRIIKPGGKLLATFFTTPMALSATKHFDGERQVGDTIVKRYSEYKVLPGRKPYSLVRINWFFDFYRGRKLTERIKEEFICRCDKPGNVESLVSKSGWEIESVFANYDRLPLDKDSNAEFMIVTAKNK